MKSMCHKVNDTVQILKKLDKDQSSMICNSVVKIKDELYSINPKRKKRALEDIENGIKFNIACINNVLYSTTRSYQEHKLQAKK